MVVDLPRRWTWVIVGLGAAVLLLAVFFVVMGRAPRQGVAPPAEIIESAEAEPSVAVPLSVEATREQSAHGGDEVEVCGGGWVPVQADGSIDPAVLQDAIDMPQARARIAAAMQADGSELVRAAGQAVGLGDDRAAAREALARAAVHTADPGVYGLALRRCAAPHAGDGTCRLLSAERWAQLDPGNAAPWLDLLAAARARGDRDAQQEAVFKIASASRLDSGWMTAAGAVLRALPEDDAAQVAGTILAAEGVMLEPFPPFQALQADCRGDAVRDANRLQLCTSIAELLTQRSDTLLASLTGVMIGRQVGWPADRSQLLLAELRAYQRAAPAGPGVDRGLGCPAFRDYLGELRHRAAIGEAGAWRQWVGASGRTPQDFLREDSEWQARLGAARPASAASTP